MDNLSVEVEVAFEEISRRISKWEEQNPKISRVSPMTYLAIQDQRYTRKDGTSQQGFLGILGEMAEEMGLTVDQLMDYYRRQQSEQSTPE